MFKIPNVFNSPMNLPTETDPFESNPDADLSESNRHDGRKLLKLQNEQLLQQKKERLKLENKKLQDTKLPENLDSRLDTPAENHDPPDEKLLQLDLDKVEATLHNFQQTAEAKFDDLKENFRNKIDNISDKLNLPEHVRFPQKFRESVRKLYVEKRDSDKLPKTVRLYRERLIKNNKENSFTTFTSKNKPTVNSINLPPSLTEHSSILRNRKYLAGDFKNLHSPLDPYNSENESPLHRLTQPMSRKNSVTARNDLDIDNFDNKSGIGLYSEGQYINDRSVDFMFRPYGLRGTSWGKTQNLRKFFKNFRLLGNSQNPGTKL